MSDQPRRPGVLCPDCGRKMFVHRCTRFPDGRVLRRRQCPQCGIRVTTEERPVGPYGHTRRQN
jgi:DNA-directed RNA polymerase subunit RPC12/RpoP